MASFTEKERLLRVLEREAVDRPPAICPGGMMNAAVVEVMKKTGHTLPEAHFDGRLMAQLASDVQRETGFENFGVPFCMTVEAEVLGSPIEFGSLSCEPKIKKERYPSVSRVEEGDIHRLLSSGRIDALIDAIGRLSEEYPRIPITGTLTGPISLAASIVDPMTFYRELRKDREGAHRVLTYVSDILVTFAALMVDAGAHVIAIADPSATGEILGPRLFEEYAVPYLNRVIERIHALHVPVILHICGDLKPVRRLLTDLRSDALSLDAVVNLRNLKREFPGLTTMGNVSTYLLEFGDAGSVAKKTRQLVLDGVDIISPACGLSTSTPLDRIRAITETAKEYNG